MNNDNFSKKKKSYFFGEENTNTINNNSENNNIEQETYNEIENIFEVFSNIKDSNKFQILRYLIGFTDFFNNVNEFLDINSKTLRWK